MEPTPSGIQFIEGNELGNALSNSLSTLTNIKLREEQMRLTQEQKLEEALTVVTSGMANRDASEINASLQSFIEKTKKTAKHYNGKIPFDEWAKIKAEKANIEAMVKKSAGDQEEFNNIAKYIRTTGRNYIDQEATNKSLQEMMQKGLMERDDLWSTVAPHVDPLKIIRDNVSKFQSGGYEIKGNKIIKTKSNDAEKQIRNLMVTRDDLRRTVTAQWQENPMGFATPEDYAVAMFGPHVQRDSETASKWGATRVGTTKKSTKQYAVEADGSYNFSTSPIILHDITDAAGRSIGTFSISKLREEDGKFIGIGTSATNFYYSFDDLANASKAVAAGKGNSELQAMADLYESIPGASQADKKVAYPKRLEWDGEKFENPNKKAGESIEIELSDSDAALVKEKLSSWSKIEAKTPAKKAATGKSKTDSKGIL